MAEILKAHLGYEKWEKSFTSESATLDLLADCQRKGDPAFAADRPQPNQEKSMHLLVLAPPHSGRCRQGTYRIPVSKSRATQN